MTLINAKSNNKAASLPPNEEMLVNLIFPVLSHFTVYFSLCLLYRYNTALKKHSQCKSLVILLMARGSGFFYALPTLIFSVFTGEFRFNEAVNIMRSQKLVILSHSRSFRQTWSYSACLYFLPCIHAFRKLCKRLHWYLSFINYLSLCLQSLQVPIMC